MMKKLLTLLVFAVLSVSAFSTVTVEKVTWADGSTANKVLHPGDVVTCKVTYISDEVTTIYLIGNSKGVAGSLWSEYWCSTSADIAVAANETVIDVNLVVPNDVSPDPAIRVFVAKVENGKWGDRILNTSAKIKSTFGSIEANATEYNITYSNLGTVDNANNPLTYLDTESTALSAPQGDSIGYAFVGWCADAALLVPVNDPAIAVGGTSDTTFYAKWDVATTSPITYMNMGTIANANNPTTYNDLEDVTLVEPSGDSVGYVFAGWFTTVGDASADTVSTPAIVTGTSGEKTFYAKWNAAFALTDIAWVDFAGDIDTFVENSQQVVRLSYVNATADDSLYLLMSSKDNFGTLWGVKKIGFDPAATSMDISFTVRDYFPEHMMRIIFGQTATTLWGERETIANDGDDAIYAYVEEDISTVSQAITTSLVNVYPNPSQGIFNVKLNEESSLAVYNLAGKLVYTQSAVNGTQVMDLSTLESGLFLLTVKGETSSETIKLQIK